MVYNNYSHTPVESLCMFSCFLSFLYYLFVHEYMWTVYYIYMSVNVSGRPFLSITSVCLFIYLCSSIS